jgi:hypothetical protein
MGDYNQGKIHFGDIVRDIVRALTFHEYKKLNIKSINKGDSIMMRFEC